MTLPQVLIDTDILSLLMRSIAPSPLRYAGALQMRIIEGL